MKYITAIDCALIKLKHNPASVSFSFCLTGTAFFFACKVGLKRMTNLYYLDILNTIFLNILQIVTSLSAIETLHFCS